MTLDFIKFISESTSKLDAEKKAAMLADFCENFGTVDLKPADQVAFANERINDFIIGCVNETRKKRAETALIIEKLVIE